MSQIYMSQMTEFIDSDPRIVRKGLIELYLNVKIRSADEVSQLVRKLLTRLRLQPSLKKRWNLNDFTLVRSTPWTLSITLSSQLRS